MVSIFKADYEYDASGVVVDVRNTEVIEEELITAFLNSLAELMEDNEKHIVVDLSNVETVASRLLAVFLKLTRKAQAMGGAFVLRKPKPSIIAKLATCRLLEHLNIEK